MLLDDDSDPAELLDCDIEDNDSDTCEGGTADEVAVCETDDDGSDEEDGLLLDGNDKDSDTGGGTTDDDGGCGAAT